MGDKRIWLPTQPNYGKGRGRDLYHFITLLTQPSRCEVLDPGFLAVTCTQLIPGLVSLNRPELQLWWFLSRRIQGQGALKPKDHWYIFTCYWVGPCLEYLLVVHLMSDIARGKSERAELCWLSNAELSHDPMKMYSFYKGFLNHNWLHRQRHCQNNGGC